MFLSNDDESSVDFVVKSAGWRIGDFAQWNSSGGKVRGQVERVVREGELRVPDTSFTINAEKDDPAVLLRVFRWSNQKWNRTNTLVGHRASALSRAQ